MNNLTKFVAGSTYFGRFVTDADSKVERKIERRTAKSVWVKDMFSGEIVRRSIETRDGSEGFRLAQTLYISAEREVA